MDDNKVTAIVVGVIVLIIVGIIFGGLYMERRWILKQPSVMKSPVSKIEVAEETGVKLFDPAQVIEVGNHSYIPINRNVSPGKFHVEIMTILDWYDKSHRDRDVYDTQIVFRADGGYFIEGIFIHYYPLYTRR